MVKIRRKGVAIVESKEGILVVAGKRKVFAPPGGGAEKNESRKNATIRELREETGLKAKSVKYLFSYEGKRWKDSMGRETMNHAKVFLIKSYGSLKPGNEIRHAKWYNPKSRLRISNSAKKVIEQYLNLKLKS